MLTESRIFAGLAVVAAISALAYYTFALLVDPLTGGIFTGVFTFETVVCTALSHIARGEK